MAGLHFGSHCPSSALPLPPGQPQVSPGSLAATPPWSLLSCDGQPFLPSKPCAHDRTGICPVWGWVVLPLGVVGGAGVQPKEPQMSVLALSSAPGLLCPSGRSDHRATHGYRPRKGAPAGPSCHAAWALTKTPLLSLGLYTRDHRHHPPPQSGSREGRILLAPGWRWDLSQADPAPA